MLLLVLPQAGVRRAEQWTAALVAAVLGCFIVDLFISRPPLRAVVSGLTPTLHREGIYSAVSLLGANIMPHNFYLHSALVAGQARRGAAAATKRLCDLNFVDIACALGLALCINVAVLLVAASTFHATGVRVDTLQVCALPYWLHDACSVVTPFPQRLQRYAMLNSTTVSRSAASQANSRCTLMVT